ncbi:ABC transporter substrate-binding protein [Rhizobiaceae bacterium BDR2-2]|uniref:ABC transporter substrate-binding protein n=1 Tax=Ectorhizobium quercum TaxID=2965071 RepID=A0AAE3SVZ5_9HYPH|nr:ABC transporter substrate-binding protein [Ectorhizobium quercum]MCX8997479.1 ABC transporter substrate-binding protein [Ectorhizobium quercum]
MKRRDFLACAAAAAGVLAAPHVRAAVPLAVRLGYSGIGADNRPFAQGNSWATTHALGLVEEEFKGDPDVAFEWYFFRGAGPAVNEALANRQLDFYSQGDLPSVVGRASGIRSKLLLVGGTRRPVYLAVPAGSDITGIPQLKGRKIALQLGTNNHLSVATVLSEHGLKWSDVTIVNLDNASANAALASRQVDGAFGDVSFLRLQEQGLVKVAYNSNSDTPTAARVGSTFVTEEFEQKYPEVTQRIVKAFTRGAEWSSREENRDALIALWAKSGTPESVLRSDLDGVDLKIRHSPLLDGFTHELYRRKAAQAKEFGLIRREIDIDDWLEPKYLDVAIRDLGLEGLWTPFDKNGKPDA